MLRRMKEDEPYSHIRNTTRSTNWTRTVASWRVASRAETTRARMVQRDRPGRDRARRLDWEWRIPAWTSRVCEVWLVAALGRGRRRIASNTPQRGADALHDGHRRAYLHGFHAHAPPQPSGRGSTPHSTFSRWVGPAGRVRPQAQCSFSSRSVCLSPVNPKSFTPSALRCFSYADSTRTARH